MSESRDRFRELVLSLDERSASRQYSLESAFREPVLQVMTLLVGEGYADVFYVDRLREMVARQLRRPHRFVVFCRQGRRGGGQRTGYRGARLLFVGPCRLFQQTSALRSGGDRVGAFPLSGCDPFYPATTWVYSLITPDRSRRASWAVRDWNWPFSQLFGVPYPPDSLTQQVWEYWERANALAGSLRGIRTTWMQSSATQCS